MIKPSTSLEEGIQQVVPAAVYHLQHDVTLSVLVLLQCMEEEISYKGS